MISHPELLELGTLLREVDDLRSAGALLHWDQATYMPPGGAVARGRQISTLSKLAHEKFTSPRLGELLESLRTLENDADYESDEASLIRFTRRQYLKAVRIPAAFEAKFSAHCADIYEEWTRARPENDFAAIRPLLEKSLEYSRELASFFPHQRIADPLIDFSDEGMKASSISKIFSQLRAQLVPLVEEVTSQAAPDDSFLRGFFAESRQEDFSREVVRAVGYDFERGRMDKTHHPFMTKFSLGDVRITNRAREEDVTELLFGSLHEVGHALYEQGIAQNLEATPLAEGTSSGVHESQSRLWENFVGRSRPFWEHFYPRFQDAFPTQLGEISLERFIAGINRVSRSLVRTDADELTYNLHVMIRFDLEMELLEGRLSVADLPDAWRARYMSDLGMASETDANGVLQDVHWFSGTIGGAFQGYTLGNILSAQFFAAARRDLGDLDAQFARGEFAPLREWLTQNIYRHGSKFTADEITLRATGESLSIAPYMKYLRGKFLG
ncbi:carboxypeptidase Taq [Abditibacterium utsteinense]|uniref:Metal-dependent carboxypeptidase n=1 Tax=Abditibacterium utsteinense TaxID=1960156 RepID=A0A2S8SXK3_9BACT|nr:carboxypeptidase M32 [Abditibacterium utsteinense]PQV65533.1 carboxypeptidase Taq [Abditibacterium utsteinense]